MAYSSLHVCVHVNARLLHWAYAYFTLFVMSIQTFRVWKGTLWLPWNQEIGLPSLLLHILCRSARHTFQREPASGGETSAGFLKSVQSCKTHCTHSLACMEEETVLCMHASVQMQYTCTWATSFGFKINTYMYM